MPGQQLEQLLIRIRDGEAHDGALEQARTLLRADARFPEELRRALDDDDEHEVADSAAALLAVLGADEGFGASLADAIFDEAGLFTGSPGAHADDVANDVIAATHPNERATSVAHAVHAMAGDIDVTHEVLAELEQHMATFPIDAAVRWHAGSVEVATDVLARLGLADELAPVAAAVTQQSGPVDIVTSVLSTLALEDVQIPLAAAIAAEAGEVDLVSAVMRATDASWVSAMLDNELDAQARRLATQQLRGNREALAQMTAFADIGRQLRSGVESEAGDVAYIWPAIAEQIGIANPESVPGWDGEQVAAAVRSQAGSVDVTTAVMGRVLSAQITTSDDVEAIPVPANNPWAPALALAAAAMFAVFVGAPAIFGGGASVPTIGDTPELAFAQSDEIIINDLSYAENASVQVIQAQGENGALIIWVDEETTL